MNRFVFLIVTVLLVVVAMGAVGCKPNIDEYAEDGDFGVRLRDGVVTDGGDLYLGITMKNRGDSADFHSFEAHLLGSGGEHETQSLSYRNEIRPKGKFSWDVWFRDLSDKDFPMDTEVTFVVQAKDSNNNSYEVEFILDSLNDLNPRSSS